MAWVPFAPHKVEIQLKNGTTKTGFIISESNSEEKFDPPTFLRHLRDPQNKHRNFELYGQIYSINDEGKLGGIVFAKEEKTDVSADDVKKMKLLKSAHENDERNGVPVLSKRTIDAMKMRLVFSEEVVSEGGSWTYMAFNYNPNVKKKEVHRSLLKYIKSVQGTKEPSSYNETLELDKIVFVACYRD